MHIKIWKYILVSVELINYQIKIQDVICIVGDVECQFLTSNVDILQITKWKIILKSSSLDIILKLSINLIKTV